ncbi:formate/nitrite transporter family protein [Clostridium sp.]|uniref:formate/nitrite transporter family protein n=1 Tax=Clostridium sp. TaxID=1506 RepID=UPI002FCAA7D7
MYGEDFSKVILMAKKKRNFLKDNKLGYLLSAMLAGLFVGFGIMLAFTVGGTLNEASSPYTKIIIGLSFSVALALVIFAGAELFTSSSFVMASGVLGGEVSLKDLIKVWFFCYFGNFMGAILGVGLYYSSGLWKGTSGEYMAYSAMKKIDASYSELFIRGILCNILVCLAVWCTIRMKEETGKILVMTLCIYVFVTTGFEHSIANMTLLTIGYVVPYGAVTLSGILYNLFFVTLGNIVGGVLFVAVPYYLISKNRQLN